MLDLVANMIAYGILWLIFIGGALLIKRVVDWVVSEIETHIKRDIDRRIDEIEKRERRPYLWFKQTTTSRPSTQPNAKPDIGSWRN